LVSLLPHIEAYRNREVLFQYRKRTYIFSLSLGLFSSAGIDSGSRFLLKVFSDFLDDRLKEKGIVGSSLLNDSALAGLFGGKPPLSVLDAGSGIGVLGICAAGALIDLVSGGDSVSGDNSASGAGPQRATFNVRAQDRDELARIFTEYNALNNGLGTEIFNSYAEPLLAGPPGWNLIFSNIPAKAGKSVLMDFVSRSARLLKKDGKIFLVAVNSLSDFFRLQINTHAALLKEENGKEHTVFVYGRAENGPGNRIESGAQYDPVIFDRNFPGSYPFYFRKTADQNEYRMENISYRLDTIHGAPDFDSPGGALEAAAKLSVKINLASKLAPHLTGEAAMLIHEGGQGHFALWLSNYMRGDFRRANPNVVLSGRNILALSAAQAALKPAEAALESAQTTTVVPGSTNFTPIIIPAVDIFLDRERITSVCSSGKGFFFIAYFPEIVPETDRREDAWEGLSQLCAEGGIVIAGMSSSDSERYDRKKSAAFSRLGEIKRKGFRAFAYKKIMEI